MIKKFTVLLIALLLGNACNMVKAPEFKGIDSINLMKNKSGKMVLVANAKYHNPNLLGGKFKINDVKVFVNDKFLANVNADTYKVPAKKDFTVPLEVDFDQTYFKKDNILDALHSALKNKLKVRYNGKIYYISAGLNIPYTIDYTQEVKLFE